MRKDKTRRIDGYKLILASAQLLPALAFTRIGLLHWPVFLFAAAPLFFLFFLFLFWAAFPACRTSSPMEESVSGHWF